MSEKTREVLAGMVVGFVLIIAIPLLIFIVTGLVAFFIWCWQWWAEALGL